MKHVYALLIKFLMVAVVLSIILKLTTYLTYGEIFTISAVVTVIAYVIGDLLILPVSTNTTATICDVLLAAFTIYAFNFIWTDRAVYFTSALFAAIILGAGEWLFHIYVVNNVLPELRK